MADTIARARDQAICDLLAPLLAGVKSIINGKACQLKGKALCDSTALESIIMACKRANIDPSPLLSGETPPYSGNIRELHAAIRDMENTNFYGHKCNPIGQAKMWADSALVLMPSPLTMGELRRLEKNARISGWCRMN